VETNPGVGVAEGYYLRDTAGTIETDNSTLAISFRTMNSNSAQGGLTAQIGSSSQTVGIFFIADIIGIHYNHTLAFLKKHVSRGLHTTMIVRFTATGFDVQYDVEGFRSSESVVAPIADETASNFLVGFDSYFNSGMYGFVSQVVGINRAISDEESGRLMTWMHDQPIPDAYPVTKPLVAIVGDSIANGDQVPGWKSWGFRMLDDLAQTHPDVQLLNDAFNGSGIPTVKNSTYSDDVLPWYSADRAKNILIVAAGTNDLLNGTALVPDILDRYYGLIQAARATGWKTVACTVLPRADAADGPTGFEPARIAFNADLRAHASNYDALADVAAITGMGAAGDAANTTYYTADKIHPNPAGHALMEPVYRAAVAGLL
jgi:lysophospholipase L1-like esterase